MTTAALLNQPNKTPLTLEPSRPVHFIGVGGVGMSALAKVLLAQGFSVSGSDQEPSPYSEALQSAGAKIFTGHRAEQVPEGAVVVASSAIRTDNPEAVQAGVYELPIYHRSDLLRALMARFDTAIGLTGTHGKTSMTGMTGLILHDGGLAPTIIAGGKIPHLKSNAVVGEGTRFVVAELDESDGTVVQYQPQISVISNLELDHPDHYQGGYDAVEQTFKTYLDNLKPGSLVVFNMNCPNTRRLSEYTRQIIPLKVYPEGTPDAYDGDTYWLDNAILHLEGGYQADLYEGHNRLGQIWLQTPGRHNLANAMMSMVVGHRLGIPFETMRRTMENFTGMGRRFEQLGTFNKARIVDDYGHHPTEVQATLAAAREFNRYKGRVLLLFQPHRYQRLQALWSEFLTAFEDADEVYITDVYAAGDAPIGGVNSASLVKAMTHPAAEYWPSGDWSAVIARLKTVLTPDDLLITMGAGDITQVGRRLLADIEAAS